jgi:hypothetical protein
MHFYYSFLKYFLPNFINLSNTIRLSPEDFNLNSPGPTRGNKLSDNCYLGGVELLMDYQSFRNAIFIAPDFQ